MAPKKNLQHARYTKNIEACLAEAAAHLVSCSLLAQARARLGSLRLLSCTCITNTANPFILLTVVLRNYKFSFGSDSRKSKLWLRLRIRLWIQLLLEHMLYEPKQNI
jgi:hypothetical protein